MRVLTYKCLQCSRNINFSKTNLAGRFHVLTNNRSEYLRSLHLVTNSNSIYYKRNETISIQHRSVRNISVRSVIETYYAIFQAVSESKAVAVPQSFLTNFHDVSGLPWWATIAVTTFVFRSSVTLPLALYQQYIIAKIEMLKVEFAPIVKEIQKEMDIGTKQYNWSPAFAASVYRRSVKKQWDVLIVRENCHPAKTVLLVLVQFPMWILFSMSIRNLVSMRPLHDEAAIQIFGQMESENFLWIHNLTVPDGSLITSSLLCLVSLSIVEVNRLIQVGEPTRFKKIVTNLARGFAILIFPMSMFVPSCLSFYWLTSATVGLCQNLVVMSPRLKLFVGIPETPSMMKHPYSHLWKRIQDSFSIRKTVEKV